MKGIVRNFVNVFGTCVIIVSLCSGCASSAGSRSRAVVNIDDLEHFKINCQAKQEQMMYLQSLRRTSDDMLLSFSGWTGYDHHVNWLINEKLIYLRSYC